MYIAHVVAVDEVGNEVTTSVPMKSEEPPLAEDIIQQLDEQYPHLKHRVVSIDSLKTPDQVENWHQSFLGTIFGEETHPEDPNKND